MEQLRKAATLGELPAVLKDQIAFVAAIADQAWYMQQLSLKRLAKHEITAEQAYGWNNEKVTENGTTVALAFVKKLTTTPQAMTDTDIERLSEYFSDRQIAEIVYHTGNAALLNRLTETVALGYDL